MSFNPTKAVDMSAMDLIVKSVQYNANQGSQGVHIFSGDGTAPSSVTTTTTTVTVANMMAGVFVNSAATAVTMTLDTAANIVKEVNNRTAGANVGDLIVFTICNGGSSTGAITVSAGTGGALDSHASSTIAITTQKDVYVRLTNVTSGSEAYTAFM